MDPCADPRRRGNRPDEERDPAPDPGNTDPGELTEDLDEDDDVYERVEQARQSPHYPQQ